MQRIAKITYFLFFFQCYQALAYEFEHFAPKGALKTINQLSTNQLSSKSISEKNNAKLNMARQELARKLLNFDEVGNLATKSINNSSEDRYDLIFKKIKELIGNDVNSLGNNETSPLIYRHQMGGGVQNFSGITWHRPQSNFLLNVNRELAPDLMSEKWIIHDTFIISIDASTLLSNLKDLDLIDITEEVIALYAGMGFQRTYHYWHFENSYLEGLTSDYSKLFLTFNFFSPNKIINLLPYEILKKQDQFFLNVGGLVNTPPYYGISFKAGVISNTNYNNETIIQALGPKDHKRPNEFLRISKQKEIDLNIDINLGLQLDFFKLLKLSLFSFDLEYEYSESSKVHLSFFNDDKLELNNTNGEKYNEFKNIIQKLNHPIQLWRENIVQNEQRTEQNLNSQYSILLFGNIKKTATEQIKVVKEEEEKYFYKNYSSSIQVIQNFWSKIFSNILFKLFEIDLPTTSAAKSTKKMEIEYELNNEEDNFIENDEKFSIMFTQSFSAAKTHQWYHKLYLKESIFYLSKFTNFSSNLLRMVNDKKLRGPLEITSNLRVESAGIRYFHALNTNEIFGLIANICDAKNKNSWMNPVKRKKLLNQLLFGKNKCVKNIGERYLDYKNNLERTNLIDLNKLKKFIGIFFKNSRGYKYVQILFGEDNVFINGDFMATTEQGEIFQNYFKTGQFRGLGVIDNYMREGATAAPISIRN